MTTRKRRYIKTYYWSSYLAYMVGLIVADGCLIGDGRHIDFTSKDLQLITLYKSLNFPTNNIGYKYNSLGMRYYRLEVSDVALYDFLLDIGLMPNKSLIIQEVKVPPRYFADFLRGEFDGDGTVYGTFDKRWRSSYMYYTAYTSASLPFLIWLQKTIREHLPNTTGNISFGKRAYRLSYAKRDSVDLFNFMYKDGNVPKLERKYKRYLEIFALDPYNK